MGKHSAILLLDMHATDAHAPHLPVVEGREELLVEPDGAVGRLAHLLPVGSGQQRRGEAVERRTVHAPAELDACETAGSGWGA